MSDCPDYLHVSGMTNMSKDETYSSKVDGSKSIVNIHEEKYDS